MYITYIFQKIGDENCKEKWYNTFLNIHLERRLQKIAKCKLERYPIKNTEFQVLFYKKVGK